MTNVMAKFMWLIARVDSRQYRQNSTELQPENFWIGVEIPMTSEYVWNAEEVLKAELGSGNVDVPKPVYTPKALQFCLDKLGEYLRDPEDVKPEDFGEQVDEEGWGEKSTTPPGYEAALTEEIDWSGESATVSDPAQADDWSGEQEAEVEQIWNEDEEHWDE